jgi:hypothetical protein
VGDIAFLSRLEISENELHLLPLFNPKRFLCFHAIRGEFLILSIVNAKGTDRRGERPTGALADFANSSLAVLGTNGWMNDDSALHVVCLSKTINSFELLCGNTAKSFKLFKCSKIRALYVP